MTLDRRSFLRRSAITLAGGLVLGDEVLEQFARLTHVRKSFPSAGVPLPITAEWCGIGRPTHEAAKGSLWVRRAGLATIFIYDGSQWVPVRV